ncbi:MAG: bifunctional riboflavin kinase/FAD synthetase [Clostridiales bacterium]|nr:bifunctional riboflavin kinase/FAD synthetase [Candidatus Cacconaster stercorequi]
MNSTKRTVIALGFFDGVHRGHGALLKKAVQRAQELDATPAVFTFDRPPKEVVTGKSVFLINSPEDRQEIIHRVYGIDRVILAPFDKAMMTLPWQDFITELLIKEHGAVHLVAGHDYHFGHKNQGNPELLMAKCAELGLGCDIIPKVEYDNITVSSTYIRTLVESGQLERAAEFLGHRHCLSQVVCHGHRIGRTIGIPTVNLSVPGHVLVPGHGVYISRVYLPDGRSYPGVTNVGTRPTVNQDDPTVSVETFLLDFDGDLYEQRIRLEFCRHLRDEQRFDSLDDLKTQIQQDIVAARAYFSENNIN